MKAELRAIEPNNFAQSWSAFIAHPSPEPCDDYGWFSLTIGPEGDPGTNYFQVRFRDQLILSVLRPKIAVI
jgi:hypothetical protein